MWQGNALPQKWWAGMEAVHGDTLFLHEYPVPSMPDHRKIFAVDIMTGRLLWANEELAFSFAAGDRVYGSKDFFDRRAFFELDIASGRECGEVSADRIRALMSDLPVGWGPDVEFPAGADEVPLPAARFLEKTAGTLPGDTLRWGAVEVVTCFEAVPGPGPTPSMREHLFVIGKPVASTGATLFHDVVCEGLSGPVPGTFFRVGKRVLYVRGRFTLRSLAIA